MRIGHIAACKLPIVLGRIPRGGTFFRNNCQNVPEQPPLVSTQLDPADDPLNNQQNQRQYKAKKSSESSSDEISSMYQFTPVHSFSLVQ
jgi:hypothetical protein